MSQTLERNPRRCSYCRSTDHDRRTCAELKEHSAKFAQMNSKFIQLVSEDIHERGLAVGALVEYIQAAQGKEEATALGLITELEWDALFFRKPGKRWIKVHILGQPKIETGSYGHGWGVSTAFGLSIPSPSVWKVRFANHELKREWCSERQVFRYMPELKKITEAEYGELAKSRIGGYWRIASPVYAPISRLLRGYDAPTLFEGWQNVRDYFKTLSAVGGHRECRATNVEEWT
jgi:hypothetical protein